MNVLKMNALNVKGLSCMLTVATKLNMLKADVADFVVLLNTVIEHYKSRLVNASTYTAEQLENISIDTWLQDISTMEPKGIALLFVTDNLFPTKEDDAAAALILGEVASMVNDGMSLSDAMCEWDI